MLPSFPPIFSPRRSPVWASVALLGMGVAGLRADDWQPLLANPPFGTPAAAASSTPGELEFRGVVQEEGTYFVNLFNPTTKTSQWVPVKGQAPGLEVKAYDPEQEKVQITQGGRALTLPLKQAKVTLAKVAVPPPPAEAGEKGDKGEKEERKNEIRDMIRARLEGGGDPAQVIRNLPPEAQAMMEEFRRRRAERANATPNGTTPARGETAPTRSEAPQRTRRQP